MPYIYIKSLPFEQEFNVASVIEGIAYDLANGTGVTIQHVSCSWEYFNGGDFAAAGQVVSHQSKDLHSIQVKLIYPEFNSSESIEQMQSVVASSISKRAHVSESNIFIKCRPVHSGLIFDKGALVRW